MSFRTLINSLLIKSGVPAASDGSSNPICNLFPTSPVKAGHVYHIIPFIIYIIRHGSRDMDT